MTDLIESVRAVNPVRTCAEPNLGDLRRKLNDSLLSTESGVAGERRDSRQRHPGAKTPRRPGNALRSPRTGFAFVGLVAAVAIPVLVVAVALVSIGHRGRPVLAPSSPASMAQSSADQRLADGTISCYFATSGPLHPAAGDQPDVGPGSATGQSPIAYCRRWYGYNAHTGLSAARVRLVACQSSPTNVAVYVSDQQPGQCARLGDSPLPSGYAAAQRQLAQLSRQLITIQHQHDCVSPVVLAREIRATLIRLRFASWAIQYPDSHPDPRYQLPGTQGACGQVISNPPASTPQFIASRRLVVLSTSPPAHISRFVNQTSGLLYHRSYDQCFTAASMRSVVKRAFARLGMRPRFAVTTANGAQYEPGSQQLYDRGCVRFKDAVPTNDDHHVYIVLVARTGKPLTGQRLFPAPNQFQP